MFPLSKLLRQYTISTLFKATCIKTPFIRTPLIFLTVNTPSSAPLVHVRYVNCTCHCTELIRGVCLSTEFESTQQSIGSLDRSRNHWNRDLELRPR